MRELEIRRWPLHFLFAVAAFISSDFRAITLYCTGDVTALEEAIARFGRPEIFNTDQGSQFTSFAFTNILKDADDGWSRRLDGRRLHRAAVAIAEIRMR